jgi:hypothetical protein
MEAGASLSAVDNKVIKPSVKNLTLHDISNISIPSF